MRATKSGDPARRRSRALTTPAPARRRAAHLHFVAPMLAQAVRAPPAGDWRWEIKFDGYRVLGSFGRGSVRLWSRRHHEVADKYPEISGALAAWRAGPALVDGEIVALDAKGRSSFQLLQRADVGAERPPVFYYVFDLLWQEGDWLLERPLEERQERLRRLCAHAPPAVRLSPVFTTGPDRLLERVRREGLEGIVGKAAGSAYEPGRRSGAWCKLRLARDQEFVIGGYTAPRGSRRHFGALLVGYYEDHELRYAGKVGAGFPAQQLRRLHDRFAPLETRRCPFAACPPERGVTWLRPKLVGQVRFNEWTRGGALRQPVFLGLRTDKRARDVGRETVV